MGIDIGLLILRLLLGFFLVSHGLQKVSFLLGGEGLDGGSREFARDGFRGGKLSALAAGGGQIAAGILFALGALTPIAAVTAIGVMIVALTVKLPNGLWVQHDGVEYPLVLITISVSLGLSGPGLYSIDALFGIDALPIWIGVLTSGVGVVGGFFARTILHRPLPQQNQES